MLNSLKKFSKDEVAQERLKIIEFYLEYGERTTKKAFGVGRKTIFVWRRKLKEGKNSLDSLIPTSTAPHSKRAMATDYRIASFIKRLREEHPRLGKEKIKPLLDEFCEELGITTIQYSTIGKIIKRNNFFFQKSGKIYHNPQSGFARKKKIKRIRVRFAPRPIKAGYTEMDSVLYFVDNIRNYFYSAIDVKSKFAFSYHYKHLNSQNTVDFFKKVESVYPFPITTVQTDNGLEFLGDFENHLRKRKISHVFIYPRCCKINGVVERYQRSLQEEFIDNNLDTIHNPTLFTRNLIEYLIFFNTKRVHKAHGLKSPMDYLILKGGLSKMSATSTSD
ncbi:MAG: DDE-type integrase/transposase/recombinase [Candidatus Levybacteria bacterium]|nr:DDE-type integrase/transposase/recombinase [Candidatus Levybacteria bacterium]